MRSVQAPHITSWSMANSLHIYHGFFMVRCSVFYLATDLTEASGPCKYLAMVSSSFCPHAPARLRDERRPSFRSFSRFANTNHQADSNSHRQLDHLASRPYNVPPQMDASLQLSPCQSSGYARIIARESSCALLPDEVLGIANCVPSERCDHLRVKFTFDN
jgi:hypothetical protein